MNEAQKAKLAKAKLSPVDDFTIGVFDTDAFLATLKTFVSELETSLEAKTHAHSKAYIETAGEVKEIAQSIERLVSQDRLTSIKADVLRSRDDVLQKLGAIAIPDTVTVKNQTDVSKLATDKTLGEVKSALLELATEITKSNNKAAGTTPADYIPIRRVVKDGNGLKFDDTIATSGGGGGGVGGEVVIIDENGNKVSVTNNKLDVNATVNATVDTTGLATDTIQTNGSQKTQVVDGSGNVIGATANALDVNIKSGASSGTQYTEGDTDASITGTAMLGEGAANALTPLQNTTTDGLLVNLGANNDVTVTGTVTANAGSGTQAVSAASLPLPTGAATSANQTTIIGHVDGIEGLLTTIDADTGNLPTIKTNTDFGTVTGGGTETGALRVTVANNSTGVLSVDDNGGSLTVDGTVTANLSATDNAVLDQIVANQLPDGHNVTVDNASIAVTGTFWQATQPVSGTVTAAAQPGVDIGDVTINNAAGASAVNIQDGGNSITVDGTITANAGTGTMAVSMATNTPVGNVAHDAADSGAPIKVGAKAIATLSGATLVAAADRTDLYSDLDGAQVVKLNGTNADYVSGNASNTDGTSTQVIAAGAAGVKHYITDVTITNTSASNIYVELKDGATAKWTFPVPANSGVTHSFSTPLAGTAATAWNFDPSAATTTVYCSASGFKSKV